jgi:hypothetical protein
MSADLPVVLSVMPDCIEVNEGAVEKIDSPQRVTGMPYKGGESR